MKGLLIIESGESPLGVIRSGHSGAHVAQNYESAAIRHFEDAVHLQGASRKDNAGHLIGFAAECAIKFGLSALRSPVNPPHLHIPQILEVARKHFGQRSGKTSLYEAVKGDIFKGWDVSGRYEDTNHITHEELSEWMKCTKRILASAGIRVRR